MTIAASVTAARPRLLLSAVSHMTKTRATPPSGKAMFHTNCAGMSETIAYCYQPLPGEDWLAVDHTGCWMAVRNCPWCGDELPRAVAER